MLDAVSLAAARASRLRDARSACLFACGPIRENGVSYRHSDRINRTASPTSTHSPPDSNAITPVAARSLSRRCLVVAEGAILRRALGLSTKVLGYRVI